MLQPNSSSRSAAFSSKYLVTYGWYMLKGLHFMCTCWHVARQQAMNHIVFSVTELETPFWRTRPRPHRPRPHSLQCLPRLEHLSWADKIDDLCDFYNQQAIKCNKHQFNPPWSFCRVYLRDWQPTWQLSEELIIGIMISEKLLEVLFHGWW